MKRMTESNLNTAYSGESMAHMRYNIYADVAESEGNPYCQALQVDSLCGESACHEPLQGARGHKVHC